MIIRGPRSPHHKAPFHPIIIVTRTHTYQWEVEKSDKGATSVEINLDAPQFHLLRYKGYIIDANCHYTLFDGVDTQEFLKSDYLKECLEKAVWWSDQTPPDWLKPKFAEDSHTKDDIIRDFGKCLLTESALEKYETILEKYELPSWLK